MNKFEQTKQAIVNQLPIIGIFAFSMCSVNSVAHLFLDRAAHPTQTLWLAAGLVELTTAWLVWQIVEQARQLTRSRISKQDRRFYSGVTVAFLLLSTPAFSLSVIANASEFGNVGLGFIFPTLSVACAVGAALPETVARFEKAKAKTRQEAASERKRRARERQEAASEAKAARKHEKALVKQLERLGKAAETLALYADNPLLEQSKAAQAVGVSRQAVGQHLAKLEELELVERNGGGVKLLVDLPSDWGPNGNGSGVGNE